MSNKAKAEMGAIEKAAFTRGMVHAATQVSDSEDVETILAQAGFPTGKDLAARLASAGAEDDDIEMLKWNYSWFFKDRPPSHLFPR